MHDDGSVFKEFRISNDSDGFTHFNAQLKPLLKEQILICIETNHGLLFDHYQVRHIDKIERYWNICLIAWTLTYWIKQNAYLSKILEAKPVTFNEFKQAINSLLVFSATSELSKNKILANEYFKIKSARTAKKLAA